MGWNFDAGRGPPRCTKLCWNQQPNITEDTNSSTKVNHKVALQYQRSDPYLAWFLEILRLNVVFWFFEFLLCLCPWFFDSVIPANLSQNLSLHLSAADKLNNFIVENYFWTPLIPSESQKRENDRWIGWMTKLHQLPQVCFSKKVIRWAIQPFCLATRQLFFFAHNVPSCAKSSQRKKSISSWAEKSEKAKNGDFWRF